MNEPIKDLTDGQSFVQWILKKKQEDGSFKRDWLTTFIGFGFPIILAVCICIEPDQWKPLCAIIGTAIIAFWIGSYKKYRTLKSGHSS
jgi:hypothetical protein